MSDVKKRNRKETQFEVTHHLYRMRKEITDLLLFDFGYSHDKAIKRIERQFSGRSRDKLSDEEKIRYDKMLKRMQAYYDWFIGNERNEIISDLRNIGKCLFIANDEIPQYIEELIQRRQYQDEAIGWCDNLKQELQYAIETLPVDINKYVRFSDMIEKEIHLIKKWRSSDNRFKKTVTKPPERSLKFKIDFPKRNEGHGFKDLIKDILENGINLTVTYTDYRAASDTATYFANVGSYGYANSSYASNTYGVRPDFDGIHKTD